LSITSNKSSAYCSGEGHFHHQPQRRHQFFRALYSLHWNGTVYALDEKFGTSSMWLSYFMAGKSLPIPAMQTLRLALAGLSFGGLGKFVHR